MYLVTAFFKSTRLACIPRCAERISTAIVLAVPVLLGKRPGTRVNCHERTNISRLTKRAFARARGFFRPSGCLAAVVHIDVNVGNSKLPNTRHLAMVIEALAEIRGLSKCKADDNGPGLFLTRKCNCPGFESEKRVPISQIQYRYVLMDSPGQSWLFG